MIKILWVPLWDVAPLPERGLHPGRPSGSAMPLAWAHGEFVKLAASNVLGRPFDRPLAVWRRYAGARPVADTWVWTSGAPVTSIPAEKDLLLLFGHPACLHWGTDGWQQVCDTPSRLLGFGLYGVRLKASDTAHCRSVEFTWRWGDNGQWSGEEFQVRIV